MTLEVAREGRSDFQMLNSEPIQQVDREQILQQNAEVFQEVGFTQDSAEHFL